MARSLGAGLLLIAAFVAFRAACLPSPPPWVEGHKAQPAERAEPPSAIHDPSKAADNTAGETEELARQREQWSSIETFTFWLVLLTAVLAIVGVAQVWSTVRLERPWILVEPVEENISELLDDRPEPNDDGKYEGFAVMHAKVAYVNHGRSPGLVVSECMELEHMRLPLPAKPPYVEKKNWPGIAIGGKKLQREQMRVRFLTPQGALKVWDGTHCIVVFGCVRYRSAVLPWLKYETRYCWLSERVRLDGPRGNEPQYKVRFGTAAPPESWLRHT